MKLWGGRFTKETNELVNAFNASLPFDRRFYKQDIRGSKAHVTMLAKQGILTEQERDVIIEGLDGILKDIESGALPFDETSEDIHSFVEANLIDRIGDPGKKLHTGRSRNDQVALDMRLYTRDEIENLIAKLHGIGAKNVILTGVSFDPDLLGSAISNGSTVAYDFNPRLKKMSHGTGDVYASVFAGALLRGRTSAEAAALAADIVCESIRNTEDGHWYGVSFERAIPMLAESLRSAP